MKYSSAMPTEKVFFPLIFIILCAGCAQFAARQRLIEHEQVSPSVNNILSHMTLEEKVGQLFIVFFDGSSLSKELEEMIIRYHIGGVVLYTTTGNIENPTQLAELINGIQRDASSHGAGIPLFIAIDQEGGIVARLTEGVTLFPGNMAIGATGSLDNARIMAQVIAGELKALGINMNFAPVMDVNNNPLNPVIGVRSFGSSPDLVASFGLEMIKEYKKNQVIPTAKHFPGHGDTSIDSHRGLPVISHSLKHLEEIELLPFREAVKQGVPALMTAHVVVPALEPKEGLPATMSSAILTGLVRNQWGYDGLIITDSLGMGAIDRNYGACSAAATAFMAGSDVLLFGADEGHEPSEQRMVYEYLLALVRSGDIPMQRIDESVMRILRAKEEFGILDFAPVNKGDVSAHVGTKDALAAAERIALESITLVRDDSHCIPIERGGPLLVIWPEGKGDLGETIKPYCPDIWPFPLSLDPTHEEIERARERAGGASRTIIATMDVFRHPAQKELVDALKGYNPIVVASRSPYDLMLFPDIPCYIATYGNRPVSLEALARILFGHETPRGRLPVDLPGLYPTGHGITRF